VAAGDWAGRDGAGACAGADCAAGAEEGDDDGAAGGGAWRVLLIRRGERAGGSPAAGASIRSPAAAAAGADAGRAGALLVPELLDTDVSGRRGVSPAPPSSPSVEGDADLAALVDLAAFFAGAGSSGWTGRRRPSASALRRTRSACASSIEDE
jgi:hypothetical protein